MAGICKLEQKCAKCGSCAQVCPVYLETGRESHCARGKLHLFTKSPDYTSDYFNTLLSKCIQCGACDAICPRDLQPSSIIRALRREQSTGQATKGYVAYLARHILQNNALLSASRTSLSLLEKLPLASGLRHKIGSITDHQNSIIPTVKTPPTKKLLYYPGCLAHHFQTDIEQASHYLANLCNYALTIPSKATCCGIASSSSGKNDEAKQQALRNIKAYSLHSEPILTSCGSCYAQLKSYPTLFAKNSKEYKQAIHFADRVQEFSQFFLHENKLQGHADAQRVYYHDPCHQRFGKYPVTKEPRQLIRNLNKQSVVNEEYPLGCCGQGGLFQLTNPTLSESIFQKTKENIDQTSATFVVTTCSSCLMGWQQGTKNSTLKAQHLSVFLAKICENC